MVFWKDLQKKLKNQGDLSKILANVMWLFLDKGLKMLAGLLIGSWVARYLEPVQFGLLNNATAIAVIAGAFATLGLDNIVIRDLIKTPERKNALLGTTFVLKLAGSVLTITCLLFFVWILNPEDQLSLTLLALISIGLIPQSLESIDMYFQSKIQSRLTIISKTVGLLIASGFKIAFIVLKKPLIYFALAQSIEILFASAALFFIYQQRGFSVFDWIWDKNLAKSLITQSWTLMFSAIFVIVNMQIDKVMITYLSSEYEAGIYSTAASLSQLWYFLPVFVGASFMPRLTASFSADKILYYKQLQQIFRFMNALAVLLSVFIFFASDLIIDLLFGEKYANSANILSVHVWSAIFIFHVSIRTKTFIIEGHQHLVGIFSLIVMLSNIVFNFLLIKDFGGLGASYASLLSWGISALIAPLFFAKSRSSVQMFWRSFWV